MPTITALKRLKSASAPADRRRLPVLDAMHIAARARAEVGAWRLLCKLDSGVDVRTVTQKQADVIERAALVVLTTMERAMCVAGDGLAQVRLGVRLQRTGNQLPALRIELCPGVLVRRPPVIEHPLDGSSPCPCRRSLRIRFVRTGSQESGVSSQESGFRSQKGWTRAGLGLVRGLPQILRHCMGLWPRARLGRRDHGSRLAVMRVLVFREIRHLDVALGANLVTLDEPDFGQRLERAIGVDSVRWKQLDLDALGPNRQPTSTISHAPQADEKQSRLEGKLRELLVLEEAGFDRTSPHAAACSCSASIWRICSTESAVAVAIEWGDRPAAANL